MNSKTLEIILKAKDLASSAIDKVAGSAKGLGGKFDIASMASGALVGGLGKVVDIAKTGVVVLGGLAVAAAGYGLGLATSYESQLSSIKALTGATSQEMKSISDLALKVGKETKYSALESAQGIEELLKAGVSLEQVLNGGLQGALDLAAAGGLELADAAEIASTALNAFKRDALNVTQVADIMAGAANASATSVGELKYGLAAVGAVASGAGMTFKDTATALAVFAQNGLKGSDAGTSLKTMLMNLQPATDKSSALFDELGLTVNGAKNAFFTAEGKIRPLAEIAGVLQEKLKGMTDQQRLSTLEMLFGSDAIRAGNILYAEGAAGIAKMQAEMGKFTAAQVAAEKMDNLAGAIERFKGTIETMLIEAFSPFLISLTEFTNKANALAEGFAVGGVSHQLTTMAQAMTTQLAPIIAQFNAQYLPVIIVMFKQWWVVFQTQIIPALSQFWDLLLAVLPVIIRWIPTIAAIMTIFVAFASVLFNVVATAIKVIIDLLIAVTNTGVSMSTIFRQVFTGQFNAAFETMKATVSSWWGLIQRTLGSAIGLFASLGRTISGIGKVSLPSIPGRAAGGPVKAGQVYAVGENPDGSFNKTTELFIPSQSGKIMNARDTQKMMAGSGGSGGQGGNVLNVTIQVQGGFADDKAIADWFRKVKSIAQRELNIA